MYIQLINVSIVLCFPVLMQKLVIGRMPDSAPASTNRNPERSQLCTKDVPLNISSMGDNVVPRTRVGNLPEIRFIGSIQTA